MIAKIVDKAVICSIIDKKIEDLNFKKTLLSNSNVAVRFSCCSPQEIFNIMKAKRTAYRNLLPNYTEVRELKRSKSSSPVTINGFWILRERKNHKRN